MNNDRSLSHTFYHPLTAAVSLLQFGLAICGGVLSAPFAFDDYGIIVDNPQIKITDLKWPAPANRKQYSDTWKPPCEPSGAIWGIRLPGPDSAGKILPGYCDGSR